MTTHRIAVIPGDGIGSEVIPEGIRVLDAAARRFSIDLRYDGFDFASCDYYARHGQMMPDDWKEQIGGHDAIFFGAVGWPEKVPDHVSLWGSLLLFRREFDQYVNLRPVRLMPGIASPLANRQPGDIDFYVVRENTEGEYSSVGGKMFAGTEREIVMQESIFTPRGCRPGSPLCFRAGAAPPEEALDAATKSNGIFIIDALLGRTSRRDVAELSRRQGRQVPHRYSDGSFRSPSGLVRRRRGVEFVRRHLE